MARTDAVRQAGLGSDGPVVAGWVWLGIKGNVRDGNVLAAIGKARQAGSGGDRRGWFGKARQARPAGASPGSAGLQGLGAKALGAAGSPGLGITWRG